MNGVFRHNSANGAFLQRACEHLELAVFKQVGKVAKLHSEAGVRLIGAEAVHSLVPSHTNEWRFDIHSHNVLENALHKTLVHGHNVVFVHEAHFHINLGELRLTVGAKILVTEAAGDLHISVAAGHHKKLFIKLRALGQSVEAAGVNAGGNEVVAGALRGGFDEVGGFNFHKAVFVVVVANALYDFMAHHQNVLHFAAAKVEVAEFKAQILFCVGVVTDLKRRSLALCQNEQLGDEKLHRTGGNFRVDGFSSANYTLCLKDVFRANGGSFFKGFSVGSVAEGKLQNAASVPKVNEDEVSEVAGLLRPAENHRLLTDVVFVKFTAVRGTVVTVYHICIPPVFSAPLV